MTGANQFDLEPIYRKNRRLSGQIKLNNNHRNLLRGREILPIDYSWLMGDPVTFLIKTKSFLASLQGDEKCQLLRRGFLRDERAIHMLFLEIGANPLF